MAEKILVDTAAWVALANRSDNLHLAAKHKNQELLLSGAQFITTDYILTEVANYFAKLPYRQAGIKFMEQILSSNRIRLIYIRSYYFQQGWQLYKQRRDKEWSLTDCTSFVVMSEHGISKAFTCDIHFEQAGYMRLLG